MKTAKLDDNIDALGELRAEMARLRDLEADLKRKLHEAVDMPLGHSFQFETPLNTCSMECYLHTTVDWKALAADLKIPEHTIARFTRQAAVNRIKVSPRPNIPWLTGRIRRYILRLAIRRSSPGG